MTCIKPAKAGIIHSVGLNYDTRSHFDAQDYIELGTPGSKSTTSGLDHPPFADNRNFFDLAGGFHNRATHVVIELCSYREHHYG